jgi:coenzyme F420-reducing hydrogenase delta subunit
LQPGIELPNRSIANLRHELVAGAGNARIIVFACDIGDMGDTDELERGGATVIRMPCVGMLPPSFVDFALARRHAEGVMIAGCAEGDCHHRLGNEWTIERMARRRDPYLRQRVDERRLCLSWLPQRSSRRRQRALDEFRTALSEIDDE